MSENPQDTGTEGSTERQMLHKLDRALDPDETPYLSEAWDLVVEARDELEEAISDE